LEWDLGDAPPSSPLFDTPDTSGGYRSQKFVGKMPKQEAQLAGTSSTCLFERLDQF
jgi:hypothetical protein